MPDGKWGKAPNKNNKRNTSKQEPQGLKRKKQRKLDAKGTYKHTHPKERDDTVPPRRKLGAGKRQIRKSGYISLLNLLGTPKDDSGKAYRAGDEGEKIKKFRSPRDSMVKGEPAVSQTFRITPKSGPRMTSAGSCHKVLD